MILKNKNNNKYFLETLSRLSRTYFYLFASRTALYLHILFTLLFTYSHIHPFMHRTSKQCVHLYANKRVVSLKQLCFCLLCSARVRLNVPKGVCWCKPAQTQASCTSNTFLQEKTKKKNKICLFFVENCTHVATVI